jgi:hypothetical protein
MKTNTSDKPAEASATPTSGASSTRQPTAQAPASAARAPGAKPAAPATVPTGRYDQGHRYGTIRYAVGDPLPPVDDGAKVKMGLTKKSTNELIPYIQNHIEMMTGNPNFVTPQPPAADLLAAFNDYQETALAVINLETTLKDTVALRDQQRGTLTGLMNVRAGYVQQTSNGNRQVILTSGLGAKNPPTPVDFLPAPTNLRVDLNGEAGLMKIRWDVVPYAKTYKLQCSRDVTPRVWEDLANGTKTTVTKTLEVGVTYVFRAAAVGKPGQSNWSPEVIRGAA